MVGMEKMKAVFIETSKALQKYLISIDFKFEISFRATDKYCYLHGKDEHDVDCFIAVSKTAYEFEVHSDCLAPVRSYAFIFYNLFQEIENTLDIYISQDCIIFNYWNGNEYQGSEQIL